MAFNPALPAEGSEIASAELRAQFTGLKTLIDNVPAGPQGPQGIPGEVSLQQLVDAISGTSNNSNGVSALSFAVSDPPTQAEVQAIVNKLDELIQALRR